MSENILRHYSNSALETTLASAINASTDTLVVSSDNGYPDNVPFTIVVGGEVILVTSRSGTTFSGLERGFGNTLAGAHSTSEPVSHRAVANDFANRWQDAIVTRPGGTYDDEFDDESIDSAWNETVVTGTTTWAEQYGILSVLTTGQSANDASVIVKSMGSLTPPVSISMSMRMMAVIEEDTMRIGPCFTDGLTGTNSIVWQFPYIFNDQDFLDLTLRAGTLTSVTSTLISDFTTSRARVVPWMHCRLTWVATNTWRAEWSIDGVTWTDFGKGDQSYTMSPTHFGIAVSDDGTAGYGLGSVEYFRVT